MLLLSSTGHLIAVGAQSRKASRGSRVNCPVSSSRGSHSRGSHVNCPVARSRGAEPVGAVGEQSQSGQSGNRLSQGSRATRPVGANVFFINRGDMEDLGAFGPSPEAEFRCGSIWICLRPQNNHIRSIFEEKVDLAFFNKACYFFRVIF